MTSFVGRTQEITSARRMLSRTRLLTLTGPGGVGKTRLALRIAAKVGNAFSDGAWLIELAVLEEPDLLVRTVATTLGIGGWSSRPIQDVLLEYLADKRLLLVLDSCEHLNDACANLVRTLLGTAAGLRIVATSHQPLRVLGEQLLFVRPLSLPDPDRVPQPDEFERYEALSLLCQRAAAAGPGFTLTLETIPLAVLLCRRLDGIPLAIELAAACLRTLSIDRLLTGLEHRFAMATVVGRTTLPCHQTMRATVAWSFDLCTPGERRLWARTSVIAGEFGLEAAEGVCSGDGIGRDEFLDLVENLVDKSILIRSDPPCSGHARYHMLDPLRRYGQEKLWAAGDERRMRQRHRDWYRRQAEAEGFGAN